MGIALLVDAWESFETGGIVGGDRHLAAGFEAGSTRHVPACVAHGGSGRDGCAVGAHHTPGMGMIVKSAEDVGGPQLRIGFWGECVEKDDVDAS